MNKLITLLFLVASFSLVSQTIDIESHEPLGVPAPAKAAGNPSNFRASGGGTVVVQNGNGVLGSIYTQSKCGLDYKSASQRIGQRFSPAGVAQPAPFVIAGIPAGAVIEKAYLWAGGSGNGAAQTSTLTGPAGTFSYPMSVVGSGADVCWSYAGTYNYRADVTTAVSGNGTYNISGLMVSTVTSGNDMSGATLMVIYSDPSASWAGHITLADGAIVVAGGNAAYTQPLTPICGTPLNGRAFSMIDDLQSAGFTQTLNGTAATGTWNWWNYFDVSTTFTNGQTSSALSFVNSSDCYAVMGYGTYYQNTGCISCGFVVTATSTPVTCSACNGTASASVTPVGAYTYTWAPSGGNAATATGLCAGNYTVSVQNGATVKTQTVTVSSISPTITTAVSQTSVSCFGSCTGASTVAPSGGTTPYTYTWNPTGGNGSSASGLCAGIYSVTIRDANTCLSTKTLSIVQPSSLTATSSQTNVLCNGGSTGSASVAVSGGTGAYTYTWAPSGGNASGATGLAAGNYTVTVKDANNCILTRTFTITQPAVLLSTPTQTNVLCNGGSTGSAGVAVSGGTGAYTYSWSPSGGNSATAAGLTAGAYTVAVQDANACSITNTFVITQPPALTATASQTNILCNGGATGAASVSVNGGIGAYSYTWSPSGGNAAGATGLIAGTYSVITRDANNCTITRTVSITQPASLTASTTQTNVLCNGGSTGAASVSVSGGTIPYSYTWSPAGGNSASVSSLSNGTYTVSVSDNNGCSLARTVAISQPATLSSTMTHTDVSCHGGTDGRASIAALGGTMPYSYTWSPTGGNASTASGLAAGNYSVLVRDANLCATSSSVSIAEPAQFTVTASSTSVSCNGQSTGSGTVAISGGTIPYSYTWSPSGGNSSTATGLAAGVYTVTIKDANNCSTTKTLSINEPAPLTASTTQTHVACFGQTTGLGNVNAGGGTLPYTYTWTPTGGNNALSNNLAAGTYSVIVRDGNSCSLTRTLTITQPAYITATSGQTNVFCTSGTTGAATISLSGGTGAYTYTWSPSGGNASSAANLPAGLYTVTAQDANGCSVSQSYTITEPGSYTVSAVTTSISCFGGTGSASVSVAGGAGGYTYTWSPSGGNASNASGLTAGSYTVTISDANNCPVSRTMAITQPASLTAVVSQTNVSCNAGTNGAASVAVTGGTLPYTYTWTPSGGNASSATGLPAGSYSVTVQDGNSCTRTSTVLITQPAPFTLSTNTSSVSCFGQSTGAATLNVSGGTLPYTYTWSPSGGNASTANGLAAGNYSIGIRDAYQCATTVTLSIAQPAALSSVMTHTDVSCNGGSNGVATVSVSGGVAPYTYSWNPAGGNSSTATGLSSGTYSVLITDANTCPLSHTVTVSEAGQFTVTVMSSSVTCSGLSNGSATVALSGGTLPYSYTWSPSGGNAPTASGLSAGTYSVLINDANLCSRTITVNVAAPLPLTSVTSQTNSACFGSNNGSATVTANGGTGAYSYSWSPSGSSGASVSSLPPGSYTVTVSDINLCAVSKTLTITEPSQYTVTASTNSVLCYGQSTGSATVAVSGNTPAYTYTWLPSGGNSAAASGLGVGVYTVNILDQHNCALTKTLNIAQPTALTGSISTSPSDCGAANGSATVTLTGGQIPYTYTWSPSGGNAAVSTGISAVSYTCSVRDINNCPLSLSASVAVINPSLTLSASNYSICPGSAASLFASGSSSYTWSPAGSLSSSTGATVTATPAATTSYSVTGANAFGCLVTNTLTLVVYADPVISTSASSASVCAGTTTTLTASGASSYTWSPVATLNNPNSSSPLATPLNTITYSVVATNSLGCTGTGTIAVIVHQLPTVSAVSSPTAICLNETALLTGSGALTYTWSTNATGATLTVSPSGNTVYTVTGSDANGCVNSGTVSVTVNQPPLVTISAVSSVCGGQSATLSAGGAITYLWNTTETSAAITVTPSTTTSYTVIGTSAEGCKDTSAYTVDVIITPTLAISGPSVSCSGDEVTFTASGSDTGYAWNTGDLTPSISYSFTGDTVLTVSSGISPCIGTASYTLTVHPLPAASATASPASVIYGTSSQLAGSGGGGYQWTPATGLSCSTCVNPVAQPTASTVYTLEVTSEYGCKSYTTVLVEVDLICGELFAPSAFSPNGDGNNETWTVYGNCIQTIQCDIFNRWGQKVFSITSPGEAWDGTLNGIAQNSGVFIYLVNATFINGDTKSQKGNFTLVK